MALPTRTQTLNDRVVTAIDTYIKNKPADVIFEPSLLLQSIFRASKMPGTPNGQAPLFAARPGNVVRRNGREVWIPVAINRSTNTQAFKNAELLKTNIDPVMTVQRGTFANYTDFAGLTWEEGQENSGPQAMIDLMQSRMDQVFRTLSEFIEADLWSTNDGVSTNPKEVIGIQHLIEDTPTTNTVWGISRATNTWQRNQSSNAAGDFNAAGLGLTQMRSMHSLVAGSGGLDKPSVIITTNAVWNAYVEEAEGIHQTVKDGGTAELSYELATYKGIPITYSDNCPSGKMYFLNLRYFYIVLPLGSDFQQKRYDSPPDQALDVLWRVFFRATWGCERFDRQGVIYGFTDT